MPLKIYWMAAASNRQKPISVDAHILLAKESGYYSLGRVRKKKSCPGKKGHLLSKATPPSEPIYHTFPYKTWQTIKMRNKKLVRLGRSPCLSSQKSDQAGQSASYKPFGLPSQVNLVKVKKWGECSTRAVGASGSTFLLT